MNAARSFVMDFWSIFRISFKVIILLPKLWRRREEVFRHTFDMCYGAIPVIFVNAVASGMVIAKEMAYHQVLVLQTNALIPKFTSPFIVRELAVVIPAFLLTAKIGASIAAETATMKVTEQVDALEMLSLKPEEVLALPRFIACMTATTILTVFSLLFLILSSTFISVIHYGFNFSQFLMMSGAALGPLDFLSALIKGAAFGAVIPLISCSYGLRCEGGAQGVGRATTQAVVTSSLSVIFLDFLITYTFNEIVVF
jgi:phospholipid/cholesterol/gamma-HCH transport system permease protein